MLFAWTRPLLRLVCHYADYRGENAALERRFKVACAVLHAQSTPYCGSRDDTAECVIFSMDRAMQLDALLGSYFDNVINPAEITLFYRTSNAAHERAYSDVFNEYSDRLKRVVKQIDNSSFRSQLLEIIATIGTHKILFLPDDYLFIEKLDLRELTAMDTRYLIPSLRMGANLEASYTVQLPQPLPPFSKQADLCLRTEDLLPPISNANKDDKLYWVWEEGVLDWGYPLALDGHVFIASEVAALANNTDFRSPNTFEANLQEHAALFQNRRGVCYRKSRTVSIPCNRVQKDFSNIHGDIHQDELLCRWNDGMRIDYRSLYGWMNRSAHEELPIRFVKRA